MHSVYNVRYLKEIGKNISKIAQSCPDIYGHTHITTCLKVTVNILYFIITCYAYIFYSPKTAANTKATKEKTGHVQITTIYGFR